MVLMVNGKTDFAHIFAAITNISVVDRYLTVTRTLHVGLYTFHDLEHINSFSRIHASSISIHAQFTSVTAPEMVCNGM